MSTMRRFIKGLVIKHNSDPKASDRLYGTIYLTKIAEDSLTAEANACEYGEELYARIRQDGFRVAMEKIAAESGHGPRFMGLPVKFGCDELKVA